MEKTTKISLTISIAAFLVASTLTGCTSNEENGKVCLGNLKIAVTEKNWEAAKKLANDPNCQKAATIEGWRLNDEWVEKKMEQEENRIIGQLKSAIDLYRLVHGRYPSEKEGLRVLLKSIDGQEPLIKSDSNASRVIDNYVYKVTDSNIEIKRKD